MAALLEPQGREQADGGPTLFETPETVGTEAEGGRRGKSGGAVALEEDEPAAARRGGLGADELEGGAGDTQARSGHALDGEQHVGLEVDGLPDQEEIEFERIARGEIPPLVPRFGSRLE